MTNYEPCHRFKLVEGIRMHYVVTGQREVKNEMVPAIVLLAGFPESWYAWRNVIPLLAESYWVIAVDLPGQGDSDKPGDGYDTQTLANKLHILIQSLGLSRYFLAAHDVGAWVAFPYSLLFGEEIERMALLDAGIPGVTLPEMLPINPDYAWRTWHFPFHALPDLPELLISGKERAYLEWFLRRKAANPTIFSEETISEYERILMQPGALRAGLAYYRAYAKSAQQNQALLSTVSRAPDILGVSSDQGSIPSMAVSLQAYSSKVEGAKIEDCGHYIPEEQPLKLAGHLRAFFSPEITDPFTFSC